VRFWPEGQRGNSYAGYSRNISATGMFIATVHPSKPRTVLEIEFQPSKERFKLRAQVVHSAKVSLLLQSVRPSGMGVKFLHRSPELERLLPDVEEEEGELNPTIFPIYFPLSEELVEVYERDIVNGGLFVPTSRPAPMEEEITIQLHLPRNEDPVMTFPARVVHRVASGPETGMGIAFLHPDDVLSRLGPVVDSFR
jgi:Tfp pilus assembly protein PilZ